MLLYTSLDESLTATLNNQHNTLICVLSFRILESYYTVELVRAISERVCSMLVAGNLRSRRMVG